MIIGIAFSKLECLHRGSYQQYCPHREGCKLECDQFLFHSRLLLLLYQRPSNRQEKGKKKKKHEDRALPAVNVLLHAG